MINLLDGDLIAYRCAASCEPSKAKPHLEPPEVALWRLHDLIQRICMETNSTEIECYLGGSDNFRKKLYPLYKANRTKEPPTYLQDCREILVTQYGAKIVNGAETDDALGIAQTKYDGNSRICSLDKDLLQVPGWHYSWTKSEHRLVSPLDGLKTFYKQIILGDKSDNVPGYDGKLRSSTPKFIEKLQAPLDDMKDEIDMWYHVSDIYESAGSNGETQLLNAQLLYVLRKEEEYWQPPGRRDVVEHS